MPLVGRGYARREHDGEDGPPRAEAGCVAAQRAEQKRAEDEVLAEMRGLADGEIEAAQPLDSVRGREEIVGEREDARRPENRRNPADERPRIIARSQIRERLPCLKRPKRAFASLSTNPASRRSGSR